MEEEEFTAGDWADRLVWVDENDRPVPVGGDV